MSSSGFPLFLRWFTVSLIAGIVIAVAFVVIVDPYDQYRLVVLSGFNSVKPGLTRYRNEIKLVHAVEIRPDVLILGHSRAEVGLDPEAPVFGRHQLSAYNLAIAGSGIPTARAQVEYLNRAGVKPKVIILGMEFLDFMESSSLTAPPAISHAKSINNSPSVDQWFWRFDSLFSLASIKDAIRTLYLQHHQEAETITPRGFNPLKEYGPIVRREGYFKLFRQRAQESTRSYLKKARGSLSSAGFDNLHAILDMAAESGSDVGLIIYPYHAQILALFEETGLTHAFEEWKNLLVREISAARLRHPHARISLFDFSGYGSYNCEKVPPKGDRVTATHWYWEAGHFKKQLGDVILETIFSRSVNPELIRHGGPGTSEQFGFELEESNKNQNTQRIYLERLECMQNYPELFAEAASLVADERRHRQTAH